MDAAADAMRLRRCELRREIAAVGREAKRKRWSLRQSAAAAERAWALAGSLLNTVLIICFLADGVVDPAVVFLAGAGRERHWPAKDEEELARIVNAAFMAADVLGIASLCSTDDPSDANAMRVATDVVLQWRTVAWATEQNRKGVAPGASAMLSHAERVRAALPEGVRPRPWGVPTAAGARKRLTRLRRRWHGRLATLRAREVVPLEEMKDKASPRFTHRPAIRNIHVNG